MAHNVFISYSSIDKPIADGICAHLESAGLRCWVAPRDIVPGDDWPTAIARAIAASRVMVLVFSQNSNRSEEVSRELYLAASSKVIIVPFKIEDIQPEAGKAYFLGRTHWLDAMNPPTLEQIGQLIERVKSILLVEPEKKYPPSDYPVIKTNRSALAWLSGLSWKLRAMSFFLLTILLVSGFLVVPKLVNPSPPAAVPTQVVVPTRAVETKSPYLFKVDFTDPQFDGSLPANVKVPEGRCVGTKVVQIDGSLVFQTEANVIPNCYVSFQHEPYPIEKVKAVEFTLRSSSKNGENIPSFAPIFDTPNPGGQNILQLICGINGGSNCVVKEPEEIFYQTKTIPMKQGENYTYRIEILDPDKLVIRFIVNGENIGEFTLPPEKAGKWKGMGYQLGGGVMHDRQLAQESLFYLDNIAIEAR